MQNIRLTYHLYAPLDLVWKALVDPITISAWGAGPVKMDDNAGTEFELWGGDIYGKNLEVIPNEKLIQDWYGGAWTKPSKATFLLKKVSPNETRLDLLHEDVPDDAARDIENGWDTYYLGAIKKYLEKA